VRSHGSINKIPLKHYLQFCTAPGKVHYRLANQACKLTNLAGCDFLFHLVDGLAVIVRTKNR